MASAANRGQQTGPFGDDQDDPGRGRRLFEGLEQRVLPRRVQKFGLVDQEDLGMSEIGRALNRGLEPRSIDLSAEHQLPQEIHRDVGLLAIADRGDPRVGTPVLGDRMEIRMRSACKQFRHTAGGRRFETSLHLRRRLGVQQERSNPSGEGHLADTRGTVKNQRRRQPTGLEKRPEICAGVPLTEIWRHRPDIDRSGDGRGSRSLATWGLARSSGRRHGSIPARRRVRRVSRAAPRRVGGQEDASGSLGSRGPPAPATPRH